MEQMKKAAADGFYDWAKDMSSVIIQNGQKGFLSATFFDDSSEKRMDNVKAKDVKISIQQVYDWTKPRGCTRLYDTAIEEVNTLRRRIKDYKKSAPPGTTVAGVYSLHTDGLDNASRFTAQDMKAVIESARAEGISCYFLGAGFDAVVTGQRYGFSADASLTVDVGEKTADIAFRGANAQMLRSASSGKTHGFSSTMRQSSAPSQFNRPPSPNRRATAPSFGSKASYRVASINLREPRMAPPSLRQGAFIDPVALHASNVPLPVIRATLRAPHRPILRRC